MTLKTTTKRDETSNEGCNSSPTNVFFPIFLMWHRWQSSHKRFNMSGNDPIKGLALMVKRFLKIVKILKKIVEKLLYAIQIRQKFLCHYM
jgi:hypothetical protein